MPAIIIVPLKLFSLQTAAPESRTKANEAQLKALAVLNTAVKEMPYDRAFAIVDSQKKLFENKRAILNPEIKRESELIERRRVSFESDSESMDKTITELRSQAVGVAVASLLANAESRQLLKSLADGVAVSARRERTLVI